METTDTKAMSLQEAKDEIAKKYAFVWSIYEANHEAGLANPKRMKKYMDEAAELYKDSCLAAQKAEHEKSITQEKAKAFDEGVDALRDKLNDEYRYELPVNPYRQDK